MTSNSLEKFMSVIHSRAGQRKAESPNLTVALTLAKGGIPVFPCREVEGPKGRVKSPYTANGFKDATTDPIAIRSWWRAHPGALVGLPTGEASGLAVLDLDLKDGKDGEATLADMGLLPRSSLVVETPSGGRHLYFRDLAGLRCTTGKLPDGTPASGVDVRAEGGFVIAPGCITADGREYRAVKGDILKTRLTAWPDDLAPRARERHDNDNRELLEQFDLSLTEATAYLDEVPAALVDERDVYRNTIFAFADAFGDEARQTVEEWARQSDKFNKRDFKRDWESAFRPYDGGRSTLATVINYARGEWAMTSREAVELFEEMEDEDEREARGYFKPASAFAGLPVPPREWVIPDLVPNRQVTLFYGDGGTGKSLLGLQLAASVAAGTLWLGMEVERTGTVLVYAAEDEEEELHRRLDAIARQTDGIDLDRLDRLLVRSIVGEDMIFVTVDRNGRPIKTAAAKRFARQVEEHKPTLVVLDTALDFYGANGNDPTTVRFFLHFLRRVAIDSGCAILLLAHPSKSGMASGSGEGGTAQWHNTARARLYLSRLKDEKGTELDPDARVLKTMKSNYGATGGDIALTWHRGIFVVGDPADEDARKRKAERRFLRLLDDFADQGTFVSRNKGPTWAPMQFAKSPEANGFSKADFEAPMERLFASGEIINADHGKGASKRQHIERADT